MPSFEIGILSSPIGFNSGCILLNSLSTDYDVYIRHIGKILLQQKQGNTSLKQSSSSSSSSSSSVTSQQQINQSIEFIGRQFISSNPKPSSDEISKVLFSCTVLNEEAIQGFVTVFEKLNEVNVEIKSRSHVRYDFFFFSLFSTLLFIFYNISNSILLTLYSLLSNF